MGHRIDGRGLNGLRKIKIKRGYLKNALGSCMIEFGDTRVVCSVTMEEKVPPFLRGKKQGWLTAEYGMLPASCSERIQREASRGKVGGRTQEIQRLIGRSLRAVVDLKLLGERTLWIDADVIQGDGGTRTASITGSFIALADGVRALMEKGVIEENPIEDSVAAVSVGIVDGRPMLDLCYEEDSHAEVDMNIVMSGSGRIIEIQGTAETKPFTKEEMNKLIRLAEDGIGELIDIQKKNLRFLRCGGK
ncbi:MAG: ribonuclease PH [Candidatus Omnitrophica bacterium]|nr:ribonuclease PH [Candidatus Omnitrophota bacterium]